METLLGELTRQTIDFVGSDRRQRHHGPAGLCLVHHPLEIADRPEHPDSGPGTEIVFPDEPDHLVAEFWTTFVRVQQADRVGVGAHDHDATSDHSPGAKVGEDVACDVAFDDEHDGDRASEQEDEKSRQVLVLHGERDCEQSTDSHADRFEDVPDLLVHTLVRPCAIEVVEPGADDEQRQGRKQECDVVQTRWREARGEARTAARTP